LSDVYRVLRDLRSFPPRRSSDLGAVGALAQPATAGLQRGELLVQAFGDAAKMRRQRGGGGVARAHLDQPHMVFEQKLLAVVPFGDRKSTRLNSSHVKISYAVFCL